MVNRKREFKMSKERILRILEDFQQKMAEEGLEANDLFEIKFSNIEICVGGLIEDVAESENKTEIGEHLFKFTQFLSGAQLEEVNYLGRFLGSFEEQLDEIIDTIAEDSE